MPEIIAIPAQSITIGAMGADDINNLITQAGELVAQVPEDLDATTAPDAQELLADLVKLKGMIEKQRVEAKAPFLDAGKKIDAAAKKYIEPLQKLENSVRERVQAYVLRVENARREALAEQARVEAKAAEEAKAAGRKTPALAASAAVAIPDAADVKTRTYWELEVDMAKLPDEYKLPDEARLRAELTQGAKIAGAKLVPVQRVVAR